jgi:hypothetical protein
MPGSGSIGRLKKPHARRRATQLAATSIRHDALGRQLAVSYQEYQAGDASSLEALAEGSSKIRLRQAGFKMLARVRNGGRV